MAEGAFSTVTVAFDGPVGTITLNRPDKLNAFTVEMVDECAEALAMLAGSAVIRCIVITGAGRAFCAGADVGTLRAILDAQDEPAGRRIVDGARRIHALIRGAPQPVIASLNGVAAGGGANLALGCDQIGRAHV